ncbi:FAD:protein FMN transferase [Rhodococcus chondri]|uniref:FAD:protein FMN transferase n=1 Tax=Rhodococcus chondri TaxID=3065941 RepID=A0ABU7JV93_9NOCA|nr:FAD:protein FMN transferase [Rhodococcus sp. CC-R104]MEE2033932.1 FAD:protein FMN transferase [Rhodococcus sp. CC-R104]
MISSNQWWGWGEDIALAVTESAALARAEVLVKSVIAETEAACDLRRGDAEIHAVNLGQGTPVQVSPRLSALLRSALWAARMTDGAVNPLAGDDAALDLESVPPIHPLPSYRDVQLDGETVLAPWGVSLDITATARADTVDRAAALVARSLECGVLVEIGATVASAGHGPAGGWEVSLPDHTVVELPTGSALASHTADDEQTDRWHTVSVMATDAVWADAAAATALRRGIGAVSWLEQYELAARLVDTRGRIHTTRAWSSPRAA